MEEARSTLYLNKMGRCMFFFIQSEATTKLKYPRHFRPKIKKNGE